MAIKVSGCIVNYNSYDKCRETVRSILSNTKGVDFTLYVVDNASKEDELEKLKNEFPEIVAIQSQWNGGFGAGHNQVLHLLDSKYHAVINPDILFDRDVLTELVEYMEQNPDIGLVTPQIRNEDGTDQQLGKRNPTVKALVGRHLFKKKLEREVRHYQMLDEDLTKPIDIQFSTGCFFMLRTEIFQRLRGFDSDTFFIYYEDMDITRRVINHAHSRAVYYPYTYVTHLWTRASSHSLKYFIILVQGMFKYFGKWGWQIGYPELKDGGNK